MNVNEVCECRTESSARPAPLLKLNRGSKQKGLNRRRLSGTRQTRGTAALCHETIMLVGIQESGKRYTRTSVGRPVGRQAAVSRSTKLQDRAEGIHFSRNDLCQGSIHERHT